MCAPVRLSVGRFGADALHGVVDDGARLGIDVILLIAPLAVELALALELLAGVEPVRALGALRRKVSERAGRIDSHMSTGTARQQPVRRLRHLNEMEGCLGPREAA